MFALDPGLTRSATPFHEAPLSTVLLKSDARWPWLILVPRTPGVADLAALTDDDAGQLMREIRLASAAVAQEAGVERINVGALGNIVPQLHVHVVGRWAGDPAWPGPVWGAPGAAPYAPGAAGERMARLAARLSA
ncbi:MAG: HIT family protein [Hyphomonadaceae bacterium]|nr:HIT family protein [Hyphomonadaceae bacterium]